MPPTFSKIALWLDSLFIAPSGETNTVRFSNTGAPDIFDPGNFIVCQSDDVITALYVYNGKLYVFGLHSFGSIEGNTPDTFYYHNISNLIGCVDNRAIQVRSIVSVPTLWWLSDKGFYYSNGNTVEYGSDFIQDLVNLNLAQVNYATNKNTQTSLADFQGDTSSEGIDLLSNPGAINLINPERVYSNTADWLAGLSLVNIKTADTPFLEVPTQFAPSLGQGVLSGSAQVSGSNVTLPSASSFSGESSALNAFYATNSPNNVHGARRAAQRFIPARTGTITSVTVRMQEKNSTTRTWFIKVWNDSFGLPGAELASVSFSAPASGSYIDISQTVSLSVAASANTPYWFGVQTSGTPDDEGIRLGQGNSSYSSNINFYIDGGPTAAVGFNNIWQPAEFTTSSSQIGPLAGGYVFVSTPVTPTGVWTSQIYDSGGATAVAATLIESGSYPSFTTGSITVYGSANSNMSGSSSQTVTTPNGSYSLSLSGFRYWQIVLNLSTTDNTNVPVMGTPTLLFNITGTWISNPIHATADNTGWGTLIFTGNVPGGTSVTLQIATSANNITYSSFGSIGSAVIQPWAKIKIILTTDTSNITSPSISSVTLTWNLTSQIESTSIDTGTTPAGFGVVQWELSNTNGTTTFYIRTATTAIGLAGATYVAVLNGAFPALSALQFLQWKLVLTGTADNTPEITSVTINWFTSSGTTGVRVASLFFNKTYYISVATTGSTANNTIIQLDQFGNWRIQKDTSIGCFLSYFNTLYFTDGLSDKIFNGFIADTDDGAAITMDVRTKAWNAQNDLFLKVPRAFKVTGINTGTTIHAYYSNDRGTTWIEMLNEQGTTGFMTDASRTEFVILFVPDAMTLMSGRTLMFRLVSADAFPCSIMNYVPSFYSRKGRYLSNG